jgi:glycosyltransferase involved in cell wall biosynthesis
VPIRVTAYTDAKAFGGAEQILGTLLRAMGSRIDATMLGVDEEVVQRIAAMRPGMETRVVRPVRSKWDAAGIAGHLRAVRALRPQVLHTSLWHPWSCQYAILAGLLTPGVHTIAWQHAIVPPRSRVHARMNHLTLSRVDAHVGVARRQAETIEAMVGLPPGSMRVINNGVADFDVDPVPRPVPGPIVGTVGRLSHEKGYDVLLRAMQQLPRVTAVLVGAGPDRDKLERLAAEFGVGERVTLTGWVADQREWMRMFDVFALPSLTEGQPLTVIEAMLASRPVVGSDVGGVPEVIAAGETGLVVPAGDPDALASALDALVADPKRAEEMGRAGRARARARFSLEGMVDNFEALYEELVRTG